MFHTANLSFHAHNQRNREMFGAVIKQHTVVTLTYKKLVVSWKRFGLYPSTRLCISHSYSLKEKLAHLQSSCFHGSTRVHDQ